MGIETLPMQQFVGQYHSQFLGIESVGQRARNQDAGTKQAADGGALEFVGDVQRDLSRIHSTGAARFLKEDLKRRRGRGRSTNEPSNLNHLAAEEQTQGADAADPNDEPGAAAVEVYPCRKRLQWH